MSKVVSLGPSQQSVRKQELLDYIARTFDDLVEGTGCNPDDVATAFSLVAPKGEEKLRHATYWFTSKEIGLAALHAGSVKLSEELLEEMYG